MAYERYVPTVDELTPKQLEMKRARDRRAITAFKARREEQGLKRYGVWVPDEPEYKERIKKYAEKLVKEYEKAQG